jgi:hypothetical protein
MRLKENDPIQVILIKQFKLRDTKVNPEELQQSFCRAHNAEFVPAPCESKLGYALSTEGSMPINGLRNPVTSDTNGWYIWNGEQFSAADDFFAPLHTKHLVEKHPEIVKLLGLPPGYRFLLAGNYLDVWYDSSLLEI